MNKKIKLKIFGLVLAFLLCFPLHFLYEKIPSFVTSIISPVNESLFEHMKILFTSILLSGIIQKIITIKLKLNINNICFSNYCAAISSIIIFLIIFLPIYLIIGENFIITIVIMFIAILFAQIISYKVINLKDLKLENITIILAISTYIIFALLTYFPPKLNFFKDTINNFYGIKNN